MPVPWVDGLTPVNAANLEIMEADTAAAAAAAAAADTKATNAQTTANAAQPKAEEGQPNGYASLDAGGTVPDAQLPAALARDAEVTAAISAHAGAADPHTGYQKETEKGAASGYAPLDASSFLPETHLEWRLRGVVNIVADVDLAEKSGWYWAANGSPHLPTATDFYLLVIAYSPDYVLQHVYEMYGASSWKRIQSGGAWTPWVQTWPVPATPLPDRLAAYTTDNLVYDANDATANGWYKIYWDGSNVPHNACAWHLETVASDSSELVQFAHAFDRNETWVRRNQYGWGSWTKTVPAAGGGVDYIGTWGGGTAYKKGDVVRHNGNDYMAVNDSTGVTPPVPASIPLGGVSIGTTLPAAPYDGQEFVLVDSLTNPAYTWRFRYNAGSSSAYKWEFIGGSTQRALVSAQENTASATFVALATPGPQVTLPRAGEYDVRWGAFAYNTSGSASTGTQMALYLNGSPTAQTMFSGVGFYHHASKDALITAAGAGYSLVALYSTMGGGTGTWGERVILVTPRRVA